MISTKGRYSIRILLDLAQHYNGRFIPMKDVAARQDISLKYIERLTPALKAAGLIESVHGIGGGYRLTRLPEEYTLWEILSLAEGDLAPVACLEGGECVCTRQCQCVTVEVFRQIDQAIDSVVDHITLRDLVNMQHEKWGGDSPAQSPT